MKADAKGIERAAEASVVDWANYLKVQLVEGEQEADTHKMVYDGNYSGQNFDPIDVSQARISPSLFKTTTRQRKLTTYKMSRKLSLYLCPDL